MDLARSNCGCGRRDWGLGFKADLDFHEQNSQRSDPINHFAAAYPKVKREGIMFGVEWKIIPIPVTPAKAGAQLFAKCRGSVRRKTVWRSTNRIQCYLNAIRRVLAQHR